MEMTTAKTVAVFAIIFGCFAVLYPKIFHPMVLHVFGLSQPKPKADDIQSRMPQNLRPDAVHAKSHSARDDIPVNHMRGGPHPGLRAAAEMRKQAAAQQGSSGKGMMGVVLPMYAVGIVIYLIYTMTKVFGRKEKSDGSGNGDYLGSHFSDIRYNADKQKFVASKEEELQRKKVISQQKDLEKLLLKADREDISDVEMLELKRRLLETEAQMARILEAMEAVQQKVGSTVAAAGEVLSKGGAESAEASQDHADVDDTEQTQVVENDDEDDVESVGFVEEVNEVITSDDEDEADKDLRNDKTSNGKDCRNSANLAEELNSLMNNTSSVNLTDDCGKASARDDIRDLRHRIVDRQRSD